MNLTDFKQNEHNGGVQVLLDYTQYQLSIIKSDFSYGGKQGLYEIGVFDNNGLVELADITSEGDTVRGHLTETQVDSIIKMMTMITKETPKQIN
jgi:hypothetical protein